MHLAVQSRLFYQQDSRQELRQKYRSIADEPKNSKQGSLSPIKNDRPNKVLLSAVILRSNDLAQTVLLGKTSLRVEDVFDGYQDVFPEDLPSGLPTKRALDLHTDVELDTKPQRKGIFLMSLTELNELQKQLDGLLKKEFIRPSNSS